MKTWPRLFTRSYRDRDFAGAAAWVEQRAGQKHLHGLLQAKRGPYIRYSATSHFRETTGSWACRMLIGIKRQLKKASKKPGIDQTAIVMELLRKPLPVILQENEIEQLELRSHFRSAFISHRTQKRPKQDPIPASRASWVTPVARFPQAFRTSPRARIQFRELTPLLPMPRSRQVWSGKDQE
jgi:hypothetical protein